MEQTKYCPWCMNKSHKTDLDFSIVDDDTGHYVSERSINFCPFCGRPLRDILVGVKEG